MFIFIWNGLTDHHGDMKTGLFPFAHRQEFTFLSHFHQNFSKGLNSFVATFNGVSFSVIEIFIGNINRCSVQMCGMLSRIMVKMTEAVLSFQRSDQGGNPEAIIIIFFFFQAFLKPVTDLI